MATYTDLDFGQINDEHLTRFINGMAAHWGYSDTDENGDPNTESKPQYIKRKQRLEWITRIRQQERIAAEKALEEQDPVDII